jgi:hypothetical protein
MGASGTFGMECSAQGHTKVRAPSRAVAVIVGMPAGVVQNAVMSPFSFPPSVCQLRSAARSLLALAGTASDNRLLGTDTQLKAAAARQGLRAAQCQRYALTVCYEI